MAAFTGMDIPEVRALAAQMNSAAEEITGLANSLTSKLEGTPWVGPDREKFVSEWHGQYKSQLVNIASALHGAAGNANANASAQEQASNS